MNKIFLIGYMGAGKTTVGKRLAQALGWQFIDMDLFIESRYHKKISEIFAEKGEAYFREIERKVLEEIVEFENTVVSTGGGAPCFFNNMERMNQAGITVYLKSSAEDLAGRLDAGKQKRPLLQDKSPEEWNRFIAGNLNARETLYNRAAIIFPMEKITPQGPWEAAIQDLTKQINTYRI